MSFYNKKTVNDASRNIESEEDDGGLPEVREEMDSHLRSDRNPSNLPSLRTTAEPDLLIRESSEEPSNSRYQGQGASRNGKMEPAVDNDEFNVSSSSEASIASDPDMPYESSGPATPRTRDQAVQTENDPADEITVEEGWCDWRRHGRVACIRGSALALMPLTPALYVLYTMVQYNFDNSNDTDKKVLQDQWINKRAKRGFFANKFREFCNRTDLHGYKYIVMEDITVTERSCWALAVLVSVGFAAYFVVTAYLWYARNPIVTVIESTHGAIWDVPFPAVTICDLNVISRKAAREFANNVTLPSNVTADDVFEIIRWAPLLHSTFKSTESQKDMLLKLQLVLDLNNISMEDFFTQVSPVSTCNRLVQRCMWKNTVYRCDLLFQQVFVQVNLCCAFNYYALDLAMVNRKWSNDVFRLEAPRRIASCGYQTALTVLIQTSPDDYYSSSVASQGALVFIDDSYNIPDLDSPVRMVNPSTEVLIALSPERTYATAGIKSFRPDQRQCYYNDEITISQFRQYTYHNCMAFKKVQIIKKTCDCIPFYFPLKEYYRRCTFKDMDCLENVLRAPAEHEGYAQEQHRLLECLPECEHYDYPLEVALGMLAKHAKLNGLALFNDVKLDNRSLLNVFFNDLVSTRYRRDVYLNWQNILASFGGLLSLMLGFTLISGFDFIIFFTFRIAYDVLKVLLLTNATKTQKKRTSHKRNKVHVQDSLPISQKRDTEMRYGNVRY